MSNAVYMFPRVYKQLPFKRKKLIRMLIQLFHTPLTLSTRAADVLDRHPLYRAFFTFNIGSAGVWDNGADLRVSFRISDCEVWAFAIQPPPGKYTLASS